MLRFIIDMASLYERRLINITHQHHNKGLLGDDIRKNRIDSGL